MSSHFHIPYKCNIRALYRLSEAFATEFFQTFYTMTIYVTDKCYHDLMIHRSSVSYTNMYNRKGGISVNKNSNKSFPSLPADNCFYNGQARHYQGRVSLTSNLYICQRWDVQTPHRHSYNENDFPDDKIPDNFCRTTKDSSRPWCYTTDRKQRWEHCSVNNCSKYLGATI